MTLDAPRLAFTHDCAGDLGILVAGRVVAVYFNHGYLYNVHNIIEGGPSTNFPSRADALNAMLDIAEEHIFQTKDSANETP